MDDVQDSDPAEITAEDSTKDPGSREDNDAEKVDGVESDEKRFTIGVSESSVQNQFIAEVLRVSVETPIPQTDAPDFTFDDPTLPFPPGLSLPDYSFDKMEWSTWGRRLESERLIAIRSPDDIITSAAAQTLIGIDAFRSIEKRLLTFGTKNQQRDDLFLDNLVRPLDDPPRPTLLVVESAGALAFIESALISRAGTRAMAEGLRLAELMIIVEVATGYRRSLDRKFDSFHFPCCDVDYLYPLLRHHQPRGRVDELYKRLFKLRASGRWGDPEDHLTTFDSLQPLITGPLAQLEEALNTGNRPRVLTPLRSVEVFRSKNAIYQSLLACALFFRDLDAAEFTGLVLDLVGDEMIPVPETDLDGKTSLWPQKHKLRDVWPRVGDEILATCGLTLSTTMGQSRVGFADPGAREAVYQEVNQSIFFSNLCQQIWELGRLFDPGASRELVEGTIRIFVEGLAHRKDWQQPQQLTRMLARFSREDAETIDGFLQNLVVDTLIVSRLGQVLRAFLAKDHYAGLVSVWLQHLMASRGHKLALQLAAHLRHVEGFDYLFWLKRFSDESPEMTAKAGYWALYRHARQSSVQIWDFLSEIATWLPDASRPGSVLSRSQRLALRLILDYSRDTAHGVRIEAWGVWPSSYPLFRPLHHRPDAIQESIALLGSWLFHPNMSDIFLGANAESLVWDYRAQLLEVWSCLLLGFGGREPHSLARTIYEQLLEEFLTRSDRYGRKLMLTSWRNFARALRSKTETRGVASGHRNDRLERLRSLEQDFKRFSVRLRQ